MADCITVVTSGWHSKQTVPVAFQLGIGLLQLKDRIRAALGSAAQGQVDRLPCTDVVRNSGGQCKL